VRKPKEPACKHTSLLKRFDKINLEFFGGMVCGGIGWRHLPLKSKYTAQACCVFEERLIKVNSFMDDIRIPLWYLDFVIYHEMLHLQHGPQQFSPDGKPYPHSLRFQCMEIAHPDYQKALEFEKVKLPNIISSWIRWRDWNRKSKPSGVKDTQVRSAAKKTK